MSINATSQVIVDGIYYVLDETAKTASVTRGDYNGTVIIPSTIIYNDIEYKVTSIKDQAFDHCSNLTSVAIPNSVISIGSWAFYYCSSLTELTIPKSVISIGKSAFYGCDGITSLVIEDGATVLYLDQYNTFGNIETLHIGRTTHSVGSLFSGNTKLSSVTFSNNVTCIEDNEFYGCSSLTSIILPNRVTTIGQYAFSNIA